MGNHGGNFPGDSLGESACQSRRCGFNPWFGNIPWYRKWQPALVFLPGKSHGQRNLAGYSPTGHRRLGHDLTTKQQQQQNNHGGPFLGSNEGGDLNNQGLTLQFVLALKCVHKFLTFIPLIREPNLPPLGYWTG